MPSRSFKTFDRQENQLPEGTLQLLGKIRNDLDPQDFTFDQVREEFAHLGGQQDAISRHNRPVHIDKCIEALVRRGYIREDDGRCEVTDLGLAVEVD